jgi:hypothetical protein
MMLWWSEILGFLYYVSGMCSHHVLKGFLKFSLYGPRCSQLHHTFIPYTLPMFAMPIAQVIAFLRFEMWWVCNEKKATIQVHFNMI